MVMLLPECELLQSAKIFWDGSDGHFNDPYSFNTNHLQGVHFRFSWTNLDINSFMTDFK